MYIYIYIYYISYICMCVSMYIAHPPWKAVNAKFHIKVITK